MGLPLPKTLKNAIMKLAGSEQSDSKDGENKS
jgi:hypothetical protein